MVNCVHDAAEEGGRRLMEAVLGPYLKRIRDGRGLSKGMNQSLRAHPEIPDLIEKAVTLLIQLECLGMEQPILMRRRQLWTHLLNLNDDLVNLVPVSKPSLSTEIPPHCGILQAITFVRRPKHAFPVFSQAMTIAKHVGLVAGWGRCGIHPDLRKRLMRRRGLRIQAPSAS